MYLTLKTRKYSTFSDGDERANAPNQYDAAEFAHVYTFRNILN